MNLVGIQLIGVLNRGSGFDIDLGGNAYNGRLTCVFIERDWMRSGYEKD